MNTTRQRKRARRHGQYAETLALCCLWFKGYRIIDRGYRTRFGEIDIIARRGKTLVFAEVKLRASLGDAAQAVTQTKKRRVETAARGFMAAHPHFNDFHIRFDALLVRPWSWPVHIEDAWR